MRSRHYKVMRRRAMWESEDTYIRPWRYSRLWDARYCDYKPLSSTSATNQEARESPREPEPAHDRHTFYKDFESFRAAIDRAIARDPYGTLFGRRLQSPPSSNNSSWTSFSWFTDPKQVKEDVACPPSQAKAAENAKPSIEKTVTSKSTSAGKQAVEKSTISSREEEYQFDPISMRKVPIRKQSAEPEPKSQSAPPSPKKPSLTLEPNKAAPRSKPEKPSSEAQPKQPFLASLFFQEHGADIPVKTYKPPKIYGYGNSDRKATNKSAEAAEAEAKRLFDSSRKQQYRDLMARAKGNSIDTTALFTEVSSQQEPELAASEVRAPKKLRESPEPDDSLPLFSGTAYETRPNKEAGAKTSDWLAKEGFRQTTNKSQGAKDSAIEIPVKKFKSKLEPALDRVQASFTQESRDKSARLQTVLDRQLSASKRVSSSPEHQAEVEKAKTGQDLGSANPSKRARLEADFVARQKDATNEADFSPKTQKIETPVYKLSQTFNNVWEHVREHPNGIVAKTMKSMTNLNENYKKYIRADAAKGLTDKLVFQDESLSKTPSIYKQENKARKVEPFTPSHDASEKRLQRMAGEQPGAADKEQQQRRASLIEASKRAKEEQEIQRVHIANLATEIRAVYESEYGPIDSNHRQAIAAPADPAQASSPTYTGDQSSTPKPHPLLSASVKPGLTTNKVIDEHVGNFEPKFAKLVDNAKQIHGEIRGIRFQAQELRKLLPAPKTELLVRAEEVKPTVDKLSDVMQGTKEVRRELHEAKSAIRSIESRRPAIAWNAPQMSGSDFGKKRIDVKAQQVAEIEASNAVSDNDSKSKSGNQAPSKALEENGQRVVPEPVHTPSGSPIWNDEQIPSVASLKVKRFDSPYLILACDASTRTVEFSPMNEPSTDLPKSNNVIGVLGRLKNAPEFLKHFQTMQRAGYSLYSGTENMLIFQKKQPDQAIGLSTSKPTAEAQQCVEDSTSKSSAQPDKQAATVLDDMPTELGPPPGPSAPTAPTAPPSQPTTRQPRVRRQEKVFSGTIRPTAASPSDAPNEKASTSSPDRDTPTAHKEGLWRRFTRGVRRTVLTIAALSVGAYTIGFVAEGLGAHAQQQKGIEVGETQGPRKRIVMTGQRPGIFSTESSR